MEGDKVMKGGDFPLGKTLNDMKLYSCTEKIPQKRMHFCFTDAFEKITGTIEFCKG